MASREPIRPNGLTVRATDTAQVIVEFDSGPPLVMDAEDAKRVGSTIQSTADRAQNNSGAPEGSG